MAVEAEQDIPGYLYPPELLPGLEAWLSAFHELSCDRAIGMDVGPIPASSVARHTAGWPDDDVWAFRFCMRQLDAAYTEIRNQKTPPREEPDGDARLRAIFGGLLD